MKKGLLLFIATLLLFVSVPVVTGASDTGSANIVSSVSFRTGPSTSSNVMKYLKAGQSVTVLDVTNSYWLKVKDNNGKVGYISSNAKYVNRNAVSGNTGTNGVIVGTVSFRTGPSTSNDRIRYLRVNEKVSITSKVNKYWYAVKDSSGKKGYISTNAKYVKVNGTPSKSKPNPSVPASGSVEKMIAAGKKYLGTPYEYGSSRKNTATFDCSDFVRQAIKDAFNIVIPADSRQQGEYVKDKNAITTNWKSLDRGDLMFFMSYKGTKASSYAGKKPMSERITHVGIYLGDGKVMHTYSKKSGGVRIDSVDNKHWEYRFLYGGSAL